jgi:hypothetical protein
VPTISALSVKDPECQDRWRAPPQILGGGQLAVYMLLLFIYRISVSLLLTISLLLNTRPGACAKIVLLYTTYPKVCILVSNLALLLHSPLSALEFET